MTGEKSEKEKAPKETKEESRRVHVFANKTVLLESVIVNTHPALLISECETGTVKLDSGYQYKDVEYHGQELNRTGYEPYEFAWDEDLSKPDLNEVLKEMMKAQDVFLDCKRGYKILNVACDLLSYQSHKVMTVPYQMYSGDTSTGKNQRETLHEYLAYRASLRGSETSANVYQYIEDTKGTIILDEATPDKDPELMAVLKMGYKKGGKVARIVEYKGERIQMFFSVYGFKVLAGENEPYNKGLNERLIKEKTYFGKPKKDVFEDADLECLSKIRKKLLLWRAYTYWEPLPSGDYPQFNGRQKEIYVPVLRILHGTYLHDELLKFIEGEAKEQTEEAQETMEAMLTKACLQAYISKDIPITSDVIHVNLKDETDGEESSTKSGKVTGIRTDDGNLWSYRLIGNKLRLLFGGKRVQIRDKTGILKRSWSLNPDKIRSEALKYKLDKNEEYAKLLKKLEVASS